MVGDKIVEFKNVSKIYHSPTAETHAVKELSFDVYEGEFLSIVGPSGCGKSTVLSIICGLIAPSSGSVTIHGEPVCGPSSKVAYMLQRDHLFEWRTILGNVMLGLEIQHKVNKESRQFVKNLLETYGLGDFLDFYPSQLSGGMRQKVALIRTLAVNPEILLLDEPFSALDYQTRLAISGEVSQIIQKEKKTAVLVTHDISEAISLSDRILVLSQRPAELRLEVKLPFTKDDCPLDRRKDDRFRGYFDIVWKELDVHV